MTRHIGVFIINTLRPLIEEIDKLLAKCLYLKLENKSVEYILKIFIDLELKKTIIRGVIHLVLGIMFCWTIWLIIH